MASSAAVVTVGTTVTALASNAETDYATGRAVAVKNTGATTCYLGGSGVTSATGYPLAAGETLAYDALPGDVVYAVCASGSTTVAVLQVGV